MIMKFINIVFSVALMALFACSTEQPMKLNQDYKSLIAKNREEQYLNPQKASKLARDFYIKGISLQQENRFPESIIEFQQALRYDSSSMIYYSLAQSYRELAKNDLAFENVMKSISID